MAEILPKQLHPSDTGMQNQASKPVVRRKKTWSVELVNKLDRSISSFIEPRRLKGWHDELQAFFGGRKPEEADFMNPAMRAITLKYLGRRARMEDVDALMLGLIGSHSSKIGAFTACVSFMSDTGAKASLDVLFRLDAQSLEISQESEDYLRAFLAIHYFKPTVVPPKDAAFVRALLAWTNYYKPNEPQLLERFAWSVLSSLSNTMLSHVQLLNTAEGLVKYFCQTVKSTFDAMIKKIPEGFHSNSLVLKHEVGKVCDLGKAVCSLKFQNTYLQELIKYYIPHRLAWAWWEPDVHRLQLRHEISPLCRPLHKLIDLEGPDLSSCCTPGSTKGNGLIRTGNLLQWLQDRHCSLELERNGNGSKTDQYRIIESIYKTVQTALLMRPSTRQLLYLYIEKQGLTDIAQTFEEAREIINSNLLAGLMTEPELCSTAMQDSQNESVVLECLGRLLRVSNLAIVGPFKNAIGACVQTAAEVLMSNFLTGLRKDEAYMLHAQRLCHLRDGIARAIWLHEFVSDELLNSSRGQVKETKLTSLLQLSNDVKLSSDRIKNKMGPNIRKFLRDFVMYGRQRSDDNNSLRLGNAFYTDTEGENMVMALLNLWTQTDSGQRIARNVALSTACLSSIECDLRIQAIAKIRILPSALLKDLQWVIAGIVGTDNLSCFKLTHVVSSLMESTYQSLCWIRLLQWFLKKSGANVNQAFYTSSGHRSYCLWVYRLANLGFGEDIGLCESARKWISDIKDRHLSTLDYLASYPNSVKAIHVILTAHRHRDVEHACRVILSWLEPQASSEQQKRLMSQLVISSSPSRKPDSGLSGVMDQIGKLDSSAVLYCQYALSILITSSQGIARGRLMLFLRLSDLKDNVKAVLANIGRLMGLCFESPSHLSAPTNTDLLEAYKGQITTLFTKVNSLDRSRFALKRKHPDAITDLEKHLALENLSPSAVVDSLMTDLTPDLLDVIEQVDDHSIELFFPLRDLSAIERLAFGLKGTESLLAHIELTEDGSIASTTVQIQEHDDSNKSSPSNHPLSNRVSLTFDPSSTETLASIVFEQAHRCGSRLVYLVARTICLHRISAKDSLSLLYNGVKDYIRSASSKCIICRTNLGAKLHRATICRNPICATFFADWGVCLRLQDHADHSMSAELLLASVFATAKTGKHLDLLLPDRQPHELSAKDILRILNFLPGLDEPVPEHLPDHVGTTTLLSWTLNAYRGFLVPALDSFKIPNMPAGIWQFLLVNASPEVEAEFAKHDNLHPRHILFHGTSLDRLYAILTQGLRVLSGGPLQRHGAARGSGIYMAREPSVALSWSHSIVDSHPPEVRPAFFKGSRQVYYAASVVLGCEHAGNDLRGASGEGVHVVTDPTRVVVRYIWIVPPGVLAPRAVDVRIPMLSVFEGLRTTVQKR